MRLGVRQPAAALTIPHVPFSCFASMQGGEKAEWSAPKV